LKQVLQPPTCLAKYIAICLFRATGRALPRTSVGPSFAETIVSILVRLTLTADCR
jgi:hypothetical protein